MSARCLQVEQAAETLGLAITIIEMPQSTRTAQEAADACSCKLGQIVKSLVFERADNHELVLLLIAGDSMADLSLAAGVVGSELVKADAKKVREYTGYAIGGVAPIGHLNAMPVYMDAALLEYDIVWAAAGTPNTVFSIAPEQLKSAVAAKILP